MNTLIGTSLAYYITGGDFARGQRTTPLHGSTIVLGCFASGR